MARYIDADKLLADFVRLEQEAFEECQKAEVGTENYKRWSIILNERTSYKYDVMDAPTEDVVPVIHAKWKDDGEVLICSNCKGISDAYFDCYDERFEFNGVKGWARRYPKYCKRCGAKMENEK